MRNLVCLGFIAAASLSAQDIRPFRIDVKDAVLQDLQKRLEMTRWPGPAPTSDWQYGVPLDYAKALVEHWRTNFDWRAHEKEINARPQFMTMIDGIDMHFMHVRSPHDNALPLVLVHGWPGSFVEFMKVIGPLTEPEKHGGMAEDAFHVVIPSLPGFAFSSKPLEQGWSSQRMAEVIVKLMARLGYKRYGAQGGDWGGGIVRNLAGSDGAHCIGAHSNFPGANRPADGSDGGATKAEIERFDARRRELSDHYGYSSIQGTRPQTLGYGLNDSPAGLAAWITDKFWAWSDHNGKLDNSFTKDELLTNVMIYWITGSMPSSTRIYWESQHNLARPSSMSEFKSSGPPSPVGYALFPKEINVPPRAWVEKSQGKLIHWTEMPRGGHFAAMETPDLLVEDVRKFFRLVRKQ